MRTSLTDKRLASQVADLILKLVEPYWHIDIEPSLQDVCSDAGSQFQLLELKHSIPDFLADIKGSRRGFVDQLTSDVPFRELSLSAHGAGYLDVQGNLQLVPYICAVWGVEGKHYRGCGKEKHVHDGESFCAAWSEHSPALGSGAQSFKDYAEKLLPHVAEDSDGILLAYSASLRQLVLFNGLLRPMLQICVRDIS